MICLKRRMLFACAQSYAPKRVETGREVDWIGTPLIVERKASHWRQPIDLALAGRIPEGVLVAFRGTLPPFKPDDDHPSEQVILDWANNAEFVAGTIAPYPGQVHPGFARSTDRLWCDEGGEPGLETAIGALLADGAPRRLFITGHSKGGALANLAAWRARQLWPDVPVRVFTVAAARAGNDVFRDTYHAAGIDCVRYEVALDAVPLLPLGVDTPAPARAFLARIWPGLVASAYTSVGRRVPASRGWIEWAQGWFKHAGSFLGARRTRNYQSAVLAAHMIDAGSGYDALICVGEAECDHH
jgi:hypothetical protein